MALMVTAKLKGLLALGACFAPKMKGLMQLQAIRARIRYARLKFERYLQIEWQFGMNPCSKIPIEL
jgi:hypothetical protein